MSSWPFDEDEDVEFDHAPDPKSLEEDEDDLATRKKRDEEIDKWLDEMEGNLHAA